MRKSKYLTVVPLLVGVALAGLSTLYAQQGEPSTSNSARMTVTLRVQGNDKRTPEITRDDVVVKQGKTVLPVTGWTPARGDSAGLDLFILLDDASDSSVALQFEDLRAFIKAQPASTSVGVGYMRNGTVAIAQNFTSDHDQAAKALRLPFANSGAFRGPYLAVVDLINRWPVNGNRREIVMITDGIDRHHDEHHRRGLSFISPDVDSATRAAQRTGTVIDTIYTRGVGRRSRNYWEITNGQNNLAKLSDATGGGSYFLGTHNAVSFQPYLDQIHHALENQYLLEFRAVPRSRPGIHYVSLKTPVAGVELDSADGVWVGSK
jgi:hypothetical protein